MVIALTAIVSIAAVIVIGFFVLGSSAVRGKAMVALAKHYQGTWVDQDGNGVTIDTSGGVISARLFRSDGSKVGSFAADGDALTIAASGGSQEHMTIGSNKVVISTSDGSTETFVRQQSGGE
jgi:hypothetical protein